MAIFGAGTSATGYYTEEKLLDVHDTLMEQYVMDKATMTYFLTKMRSSEGHNVKKQWFEEVPLPRYVTYTGATEATTSRTEASNSNMTIADYLALRQFDILRNTRTDELFRVEVTPTSSTVVVHNACGGSSPACLRTGDRLEFLQGAKDEGDDTVTPRGIPNTGNYNYHQLVNEFAKVTKSTNGERTWFSPLRQSEQRKIFNKALLDMENNLMFGGRDSNNSNATAANIFRMMGGIYYFLKSGTNHMICTAGILTETGFDDWLQKCSTNWPSGDSRILVCSPTIMGIINRFAKGKVVTSPNATSYGMDIRRYNGALKVDLILHPGLSGDQYKEGTAFMINPSNMEIVYKRRMNWEYDCGVKYDENIIDKLSAEYTLVCGVEKSMGLITGVTC
jgi:hypothetical protein